MKKTLYLMLALTTQSVFARLQSVKVPFDVFTSVVAKQAETFGSTASSSVLSSAVCPEQTKSFTAATGLRTSVSRPDGKLVYTFSYNHKGKASGEVPRLSVKQLEGIQDESIREVAVEQAGALGQLLPSTERLEIRKLKVSGTINGDDVLVLREMAGRNSDDEETEGKLEELDLSDVALADGGSPYYSTTRGNYYTATSNDVDDNEENFYCTDLSYAFCNTHLKKVLWPDTMWEVGDAALNRCYELESFTLGSETNEIKSGAFEYCTALSNIELTPKILYIDTRAFANSGLTEISIPKEIETIANQAFYKCEALKKIDFSDGVKEIKEAAFSYCSALEEIHLSKVLTKIGKEAFYACSSLTEVTLPKKLINIGEDAFGACKALKEIKVEAGNTAFTSIDGVLFNKEKTTLLTFPFANTANYQVPVGTTKIAPSAFSECNKLASIQFPNTLIEIGSEAFYKCLKLENITFPSSITAVGEGALYGCEGLLQVELSKSMTIIPDNLLSKCTKLQKIKIPEGINKIAYQAFSNCSSLTQVEIPASVNNIESESFKACESLNEIYCYIKEPLTIEEDVFKGVNVGTCNLYVTAESIEQYKNSEVWKNFLVKPIPNTTGKNNVIQQNENEIVKVCGNTITIQGELTAPIHIMDTSGKTIHYGTEREISVGKHGIFLVKTGHKVTRVML
ncbi:leucine-rich repeat domain-containing protein [Alloprevotella tannerae]|uniref:leucine-rich repeat domain-containing protein n=1 Tax=Alloprevotella tannerae TaxID=76122 RepID=UPI0028896456|nr:leucine-rich repeat domain-containing protein [Alloprevotella tannerae]